MSLLYNLFMIITFFKVPYIIIINFNSRNVQCNKFVENRVFLGGVGVGGVTWAISSMLQNIYKIPDTS